MTPSAIETIAGDALPGSATVEVINNGHSTDAIVHAAITQSTELTNSNAQAAAVRKCLIAIIDDQNYVQTDAGQPVSVADHAADLVASCIVEVANLLPV